MPIILAIEPDRRQRDALAAVVRQRVGAELILADTTERALEAIGNRVPDLVLVPALLSPQDDAALAAALRVIAAAAHVRTLTIPVLAAHAAESRPSGLLSRWRRGRTESQATDGCDPAVFAEQITAYLKESAAERALMAEHEAEHEADLEAGEPEDAQEFASGNGQPAEAYVPPVTETYVPLDAHTWGQTDDGQAYVPFAPAYEAIAAPSYGHVEAPAYEAPTVEAPAPVAAAAYAPIAETDAHNYQPVYEPVAETYAHNYQPIYEPAAETYARADVADYEPVVADYAHADVQPHAEPDVPYVPPVLHGSTEAVVEAYAEPDVTPYAPPAVEASFEPDVPRYSQPGEPLYAEPELPAYQMLDVQLEAQGEPQAYLQVDPQEESLEVERVDYSAAREDVDLVSTLEIDEEEDIDLSDALAELDPEETERPRRDFSETELFDGEPVGVYTMDLEMDGADVDVNANVLDARGAFARADAEAAAEPAFAAEAIAEFEFEADGDREAESFASPVAEAAADGDAAFARAFEEEEVVGTPVVEAIEAESIDEALVPEDAEPADAEPWGSLFLSPRWTWPAMEGVPTEQPPAAVAVEAVAAATMPNAARLPSLATARPAAVAAAAEARPAAAHKRPEWSELVASLRKDIERRRVEPPQEKPKPAAAPAIPRRSQQSKPIQDEWGFFDPEQCGFAALLAKLDEITESVEDVKVRQSS